MVQELEFHVPGPPVPKGRPRFTKTGRAFTPARTRQYEAAVMKAAAEAVNASDWEVDTEDCEVAITVNRARRSGDLENFVKSALDGMNRVVFADDRQVRRIFAERYDGREPGMSVKVSKVLN